MTEPSKVQFKSVLSNVRGAAPVNLGDVAPGTEWVQITSDYFEDADLFDILDSQWNMIAANGYNAFALILCEGGPQAGVWLHHLSSPGLRYKYDYGTFVVSSWW